MSGPNFSPSPWPQMPENHPDAPIVDQERPIQADELGFASRLHATILDERNIKWRSSDKEPGLSRRAAKLPLELEGSVAMTETIKDGHRTFEVHKNQMGEKTIWIWNNTGELQRWARSYFVPGSKARNVLDEDEELNIQVVNGQGYSANILNKLEDTLTELSGLLPNRDAGLAPADVLKPDKSAILEASYDAVLVGFLRASLISNRDPDPDQLDRVLRQVQELHNLTNRELRVAYAKCRDRVHAEIERQERGQRNSGARSSDRRELINKAANHPRVTELMAEHAEGAMSTHAFLTRLYDILDQLRDEFDLNSEELELLVDMVDPPYGEEGA